MSARWFTYHVWEAGQTAGPDIASETDGFERSRSTIDRARSTIRTTSLDNCAIASRTRVRVRTCRSDGGASAQEGDIGGQGQTPDPGVTLEGGSIVNGYRVNLDRIPGQD